MIRKFTRYLFFTAMWVGAISCQDEEVTAPPKPTLQADKTSAEVGESVTFTINKVNADAVSVLPYGSGGDAGVLVKFPEGSATTTVTFSYARPGTFEAVAVANNHTGDGENVENVKSDPITITIFSSKNVRKIHIVTRRLDLGNAFDLLSGFLPVKGTSGVFSFLYNYKSFPLNPFFSIRGNLVNLR